MYEDRVARGVSLPDPKQYKWREAFPDWKEPDHLVFNLQTRSFDFINEDKIYKPRMKLNSFFAGFFSDEDEVEIISSKVPEIDWNAIRAKAGKKEEEQELSGDRLEKIQLEKVITELNSKFFNLFLFILHLLNNFIF